MIILLLLACPPGAEPPPADPSSSISPDCRELVSPDPLVSLRVYECHLSDGSICAVVDMHNAGGVSCLHSRQPGEDKP